MNRVSTLFASMDLLKMYSVKISGQYLSRSSFLLQFEASNLKYR